MTCLQIITLIKDLILAGSAITGAVVAVKGLGTWRRRLKGQSEYVLSKRILLSLFKYRDALDGVRNPFMWAYEMPKPNEEDASKMSLEQIRFYGESKAYEVRWNKVQEQRTALYTDLLEAETIWGPSLNKLFKSLFILESELLTKIRNHIKLINPDLNERSKESIEKIDEKTRDIMYDLQSDELDEYKKDILSTIAEIETYLKPKLTQ